MEASGRHASSSGERFVTRSDQFSSWEPELILPLVHEDVVRLSRGYLRCQFPEFLRDVSHLWTPFFHALDSQVAIQDISPQMELPKGLERLTQYTLDGEPLFIGVSKPAFDLITHGISPGASADVRHILFDYFETRVVSSIARSWLPTPLRWSAVEGDSSEPTELAGAVRVSFTIDEAVGELWFGLTRGLVDTLDVQWRSRVRNAPRNLVTGATLSSGARDETTDASHSEGLHSVSIHLAELQVAPALLIDYLRVGSVFQLEVPVSRDVIICVDRERWARGVLVQSGGRFTVEITDLEVPPREGADSLTLVQIELCTLALDSSTLAEYAQVGAMLHSNSRVMAEASLIISGENVASVIVGQVGGNFALHVLPKW